MNEGGIIDQLLAKQGHQIIQVDNAGAHGTTGKNPKVSILQEDVNSNGCDIEYIAQPPNSPDLNILDFCLFSSMQHRADRIKHGNHGDLRGLVESVTQVYRNIRKKR